MFDGKEFGIEIVAATKAFLERQIAPLRAEVDALKKELAEVRAVQPKDADVAEAIEKAVDYRFLAVSDTMAAYERGADQRRQELDAAIAALPKAEEVAALIPIPKDGKDADPVVIKAMVEEAVAAIPLPKDGEPGKDGAPGQDGKDGRDGIDGALGEKGADGVPGRDGADGKSVSVDDLAPVCDEIITARVKAIPAPQDGKDGAPGRDGADGKSLTVDDVAPLLEEIVTRKVAEIPPPADGKDGRDGVDGKSGAGLAGVLKDHEGCVVFTLTDGAIVKLGKVDGKDGEPGKDGAPGRDADPEAMHAAIQAEVQKQVTAPLADAYKGVWHPSAIYKRGDLVTWGGSLFFAVADTEAKPESNEDWKLAVKRGRDGKDGEAPRPPATVKLK